MRILALTTNPADGASTRFRVLQWEPSLEQAGFVLQIEPFYPQAASRVLYRKGKSVAKLAHFTAAAIRRLRVLESLNRSAELLLIHREAFPFGWPVLFSRLLRFEGPVIYDYDDAMFLPQRLDRKILARMERMDTPAKVMARSDLVLAGNSFLADYARQHSPQVITLPTCIDTLRFRPRDRDEPGESPVIGWIGSHTTARYLTRLLPTLGQVAAEHRFELYVVGSPERLSSSSVKITQVDWSLEREVEDFQRCDIGIYPLSDDEWSLGKCGFKAIQFMACGVPVVAEAVGVNRDIVDDGVNGFLASTEDEWKRKLGLLVADPALRTRLGAAGRQTVEQRFSVTANAPRLIAALNAVRDRVRAS
jgi:glycosyltransferase involved in cell wall biosynthesis